MTRKEFALRLMLIQQAHFKDGINTNMPYCKRPLPEFAKPSMAEYTEAIVNLAENLYDAIEADPRFAVTMDDTRNYLDTVGELENEPA